MTQSARLEFISNALKKYKSAGNPDKSLILDEQQLLESFTRSNNRVRFQSVH